MVIFSDRAEAVASAVIKLYRVAVAAADADLSDAPVYHRTMRNAVVLYFSPEAAALCSSIFDAFACDPSEPPRNLQAYSVIRDPAPVI
jgi:hypothetical protein